MLFHACEDSNRGAAVAAGGGGGARGGRGVGPESLSMLHHAVEWATTLECLQRKGADLAMRRAGLQRSGTLRYGAVRTPSKCDDVAVIACYGVLQRAMLPSFLGFRERIVLRS